MGTRAVAFGAKVRSLNDFYARITNGIVPAPTGMDVANTLRHFNQLLLAFLKDVPECSLALFREGKNDEMRLSMFPSLDYQGLHDAMMLLSGVVSNFAVGSTVLAEALLACLRSLIPYLDTHSIRNLPYAVATMFSTFPASSHRDIVHTLCYHVFPYSFCDAGEGVELAKESCGAIMMMIFQYCDTTGLQCQVVEFLMAEKCRVLRDLLCIIAHGVHAARPAAVKLLFYYWPSLFLTPLDRRNHVIEASWSMIDCQNVNCTGGSGGSSTDGENALGLGGDGANAGHSKNPPATFVSYNHALCMSMCGDAHPPPLYLCTECAEGVKKSWASDHAPIEDHVLPLQQISLTCENVSCRSTEKAAVATCFSLECATYNSNHPIRYCAQCHNIRHNARRGWNHAFTTTFSSAWELPQDTQPFLVEAVISLLKEAEPVFEREEISGPTVQDMMGDKHQRLLGMLGQDPSDTDHDAKVQEERRLMSRFGVYLLVGLCKATEDVPEHILGRMLAMLFQWYYATAYLSDDKAGNAIEHIKTDYTNNWIHKIKANYPALVNSCLLPHPPSFAKVGGKWEMQVSRWEHVKMGIERLFCLVPYELISLEMWTQIMPIWMEVIVNDVPETELQDLKGILSKILDPDMSPLGFDASQTYEFISSRFRNCGADVQEQALSWLQALTKLQIPIPVHLLLKMFHQGVKSLTPDTTVPCFFPDAPKLVRSSGENDSDSSDDFLSESEEDDEDLYRELQRNKKRKRKKQAKRRDGSPSSRMDSEFADDADINIVCFVQMLDILYVQLETAEIKKHEGIDYFPGPQIASLLQAMLQVEWCSDVSHTCKDRSEWDYRRGTSLRCHESGSRRRPAAAGLTVSGGTLPSSRSSSQRSRKPASAEPSPRFPPSMDHPLEDPHDDPDSREDDELRRLFNSGGGQSLGTRRNKSMRSGRGRSDSDDGYEEEPFDCLQCYMATLWYQLAKDLLDYVISIAKLESGDQDDDRASPTQDFLKEATEETVERKGENVEGVVMMKPADVVIALGEFDAMPIPGTSLSAGGGAVGGPTGAVTYMPKIQTAVVEHVTEDVAAIIPQEHVVAAVAKATMTTEDETGQAKVLVASAMLVGENDEPVEQGTSMGNPNQQQQQSAFWSTSVGRFKFSLQDLPSHLQLIYHMLMKMPDYNDPDVVYHLLLCLQRLILQGDALLQAHRDHKGFLIWCQEHLLLRHFWQLLQAKYSHIARVGVSLILHCLNLPLGSDVMHQILVDTFHSESWHDRFTGVEKVMVLGQYMESRSVKTSGSPVFSSLATAFCFLIACLEDLDHHVATRAAMCLDLLTDTALKLFIRCLELQFDTVVVDRPIILQSLRKVSNCLKSRPVLSWEFFLARFDALFLEAQVQMDKSSSSLPFPRDLRNNSLDSKILQRKLSRAHEALTSLELVGNPATPPPGKITLSSTLGLKWPYKRTMSAPASIGSEPRTSGQAAFVNIENKESNSGNNKETGRSRSRVWSRQSSSPMMIKRKSSKFWPTHLLGGANNVHSGTKAAEEVNTAVLIHQSLESEDTDRETLHLLISLLMHFMANLAKPVSPDDRPKLKVQNIVIQHLSILLGYLPVEKTFVVPPLKIRFSPMFNAFLSSLPDVLDRNVKVGNLLAPNLLAVLIYCPSPQKAPGERYPPNYSLWLVDPPLRHSWLVSSLIFLYKYHYNVDQLASQVQVLIRLVLNTIQAQAHKCRSLPTVGLFGQTQHSMNPSPSAESLGGLEFGAHGHEGVTPPITPRSAATSGAVAGIRPSHAQHILHSQLHQHHQHASTAQGDIETGSLAAIQKHHNKVAMMRAHGHSVPVSVVSRQVHVVNEHGHHKGGGKDGTGLGHGHGHGHHGAMYAAASMPTEAAVQEYGAAEPELPVILECQKSDDDDDDDSTSQQTSELLDMEPIKDQEVSYMPEARAQATVTSVQLSVAETRVVGPAGTSSGSRQSAAQPPRQPHVSFADCPTIERGLDTSAGERLSSCSSVSSSTTTTYGPDDKHSRRKAGSSTGSPYGHYGRVFDPHPRLHWKITDNLEEAQAAVLERLNMAQQKQQQQQQQRPLEEPEMMRITVMDPPVVVSNSSADTSSAEVASLSLPVQERLLPVGAGGQTGGRLPPPDSGHLELSSKEEDLSSLLTADASCEEASVSSVTPQLPEDVFIPAAPALPPPERLLPVGMVQRTMVTSEKPVVIEASEAITVRQTSPSPSSPSTSSASKRSLGRQMSLGKWEGSVAVASTASDSASASATTEKVIIHEIPEVVVDKPHSISETLEKDPRSPGQKSHQHHLQPPNQQDVQPRLTNHEDIDEDEMSGGIGALGGYLPIRRAAPKIIDCGGVVARCSKCGLPLEHFSDEELALAVLVLTTFVRREPSLAALNLPEIIVTIASLASNAQYPWQVEGNTHIPGSCFSVARQALRCIFIQMAANNVFPQLFQSFTSESQRPKFFKTVSQVLCDYADMNPASPLQFVLEHYGDKKALPVSSLNTLLANMAAYLEVVPPDALIVSGMPLVQALETFFRKLLLVLPNVTQLWTLASIVASSLKIPAIGAFKGILEPFGKVLMHCLQTGSISFPMLTQICHLCNRAFLRERDKLYLTRIVVVELCSVLRFKSAVPERILLMMTQLILSDCSAGYLPLGEDHIPSSSSGSGSGSSSSGGLESDSTHCCCRRCWVDDCKEDPLNPVSTSAAECMRAHLSEIIEYVADAHTISKVKSAFEGTNSPNRDKLGGVLKGGLSQFLAQEMYRSGAGVSSKENKIIVRFLPWLANPPPLVQQGPKEFVDSVSHIRLLSWLLLGALHHLGGAPSSGFVGSSYGGIPCQPLSFDAANYIADHIQSILAGFPEQSKASVIHMSALFHVFILCQLWTVYVEQLVKAMSAPGVNSDAESRAMLTDFWAKVTPAILSLISHSKVMAEMVTPHFLNLMESLFECRSSTIGSLMPLWVPVLYSHSSQLPGHLQVRMQTLHSWQPRINDSEDGRHPTPQVTLSKWLAKLQLKMAQLERECSAASQIYCA